MKKDDFCNVFLSVNVIGSRNIKTEHPLITRHTADDSTPVVGTMFDR